MASPSSSRSPGSPDASPDPSPEAIDPSFTKTYVKAWGSLSLPLRLESGQLAVWEWRTQAHDMQFSATFQPDAPDFSAAAAAAGAKGKKTKPPAPIVLQALTRIEKADQLLQYGSYTADAASGTLTLLWDNSYSKLRGKNLLYKTRVSDAKGDASALPFGEARATPYGAATIEGVREEDGIYMVALPYGLGYFNASTLASSPLSLPVRTTNQRCNTGVDLFFNNRVWDSEAFFKREVDRHPQFSLAYGSLGFLRALMTWDKQDIATANHRLKHTRSFVAALLPAESALQSVGRFLARSHGPSLTPLQVEHTLLQAEAYLLQSMLLFTEESYMSYVKAGLRIRSAFKLYERCEASIAAFDEQTRAGLDNSVIGGVQFGLGTFNVVISTLPTIILRVVSALGFPSNRVHGMALLRACSTTPGIRQSLSSLMLLFVHVIIPSFFTIRPAHHAREAEGILAEAFKRYPSGALFLWMQGRLRRMQRDLPGAVASFSRAAHAQPDWLQLQHLCAYELGFCHFFSLDYLRSAQCWDRLVKENSWSKAFFTYMQACCMLSLAKEHTAGGAAVASSAASSPPSSGAIPMSSASYGDEAMRLFAQVEPAITRKFGGRTIGIEQFVLKRATAFMATGSGGRPPILPSLELIYLFYGLIQMPDSLLMRCLAEADAVLGGHASASLDPEERALAILLKASTLKGLRRWNEAKLLLTQLDSSLHGSDAHVSLDPASYIAPFARFELASLIMEQVQEKDQAMEQAAAGAPAKPASCSLDQPMPLDAGPGTAPASAASTRASTVASAAPPSAWESHRLSLLEHAWSLLKKAESSKASYLFANRLHLRIHLACVEVSMMRKHWQEIQGNVQNDADMEGEQPAHEAQGVHSDSEGEAE